MLGCLTIDYVPVVWIFGGQFTVPPLHSSFSMNIIISRALKSVICIDFWFAFFVWILKPVTSRNPLSDTIGSVLIWHMYHPWSDGLRSFIVNCQRSPSRSTTEIRGLRVITLASIVKMVWVRTLIHDIWNFENISFGLRYMHNSCTCKHLLLVQNFVSNTLIYNSFLRDHPCTNYVSRFWVFCPPPFPLVIAFSTERNKRLPFSDPPLLWLRKI